MPYNHPIQNLVKAPETRYWYVSSWVEGDPAIVVVVVRAGEPEPGVFGSLELEPEPLEKKNQEPEPELLEKKSAAGAGAAKN